MRPPGRAKRDKLDRKLNELKSLLDEAQISQKAYEKARDKHRIRAVMEA